MDLMEHQLTIDNIPMNYTELGTGNHVVLFCCGIFGWAQQDFGPVFEKIDKSRFRIICIDPPGYGKSRPYSRNFHGMTVSRDAKIYLKLLDTLNIDKFSVVGWSSGGSTAQVMAIENPHRVQKIVFWGCYGQPDQSIITFPRAFRYSENWKEEVKAPLLKMYGSDYWNKMLNDWGDGMEFNYKVWTSTNTFVDFSSILCSTLILHGRKDGLIKEHHPILLQKTIKKSKLHFIDNGGHNLHLTHTQEFIQQIEAFLNEEENS